MFQFRLWHIFAVVIWAAAVFWIARQVGPLPVACLFGLLLIGVNTRLGMVVTQSLHDRWTGGVEDRWPRPPIEVWTKTTACCVVGLMLALAMSLVVVPMLCFVRYVGPAP